jgi:hypothetical protein
MRNFFHYLGLVLLFKKILFSPLEYIVQKSNAYVYIFRNQGKKWEYATLKYTLLE